MSEQTSRTDVKFVSRLAAALLVALGVGCAIELWRTLPAQAPGLALVVVLLLQIAALTALWAVPVAAVSAVVFTIGRRISAARRDLSWLVLIPPGAFAWVTASQLLYKWATRAFVRQDLAGAVVPVVQLAALAALAGAGYLVHRATRRWHAQLTPPRVLVVVAVLSVALAAAHLARFSAVTQDAMFPVLAQLACAGLLAVPGAALLDRWPAFRRGWRTLLGAAAALVALLAAMLFGGHLAPLSYPVVASALQQRGLAAARVVALTRGIGDADGDAFSRFFGGDCNDGNAAIHPLAKDIPGDGIDQDCFEGDESADAVARDLAGRAQRPPGRQRARNVIFITVDALRADAVGFGGAPHPTTPTLDALAERGTVFSRAYTAAPMTRRAFPSLLAGRYPSNVHWLDLQTKYQYTVSAEDDVYMAEAASQAGIATACVLAFSYGKLGHFDQGFQINKVHPASRSPREINANLIVDDALRQLKLWADDPKEPRFLMWLHFYEAHYPYERHQGIDFGDSDQERYLGEVRWIDDQIGRLLEGLTTLLLADETAIVFTSDHGEEFGEHGGQWHGDLYPEDLHVPLLVVEPGGAARRVDTPVSLIDVAPTILDLLGVAVPAGYDGESLLPLVDGQAPPADRVVFAELFPDVKVPRRVVTLIERDWQLIVDFQLGVRELFDLRADPAGLHNALIQAPGEARRLEQTLRRHLARRVGPLRVSKAKK